MARINTNRKSGFILRGGAMRRKTFWFGVTDVLATVAAGANPVLITQLNAAALALRPFTVVRTRGILMIVTDQEAADETQHGVYGEIVVSDQAAAIGITALPTPATDAQSTFHVYEWIMASFRFGTAVGFSNVSTVREFDSRAMRKVEEGQTVIAVVEAGAAGQGFDFSVASRTLIKLH